GMDAATDRRDMVRAALEGIALLTVGLIEAAAVHVGSIETLSIDGGLSQSDYFARFLAAASGRTVHVPALHEMTALGLAELCGADVSAARAAGRRFIPDGTVTDDERRRFTRAVSLTRGWRD
ncbi:MAG TPA: FGGY-family carbohydrate kinase, partial [Ancylobacter sp.]